MDPSSGKFCCVGGFAWCWSRESIVRAVLASVPGCLVALLPCYLAKRGGLSVFGVFRPFGFRVF